MRTKTLEIPIYETPDGEPTCGTKDGFCRFLKTSHFGTREWCYFDDSWPLERRGKEGLGLLIPCDKCPIHKNHEL